VSLNLPQFTRNLSPHLGGWFKGAVITPSTPVPPAPLRTDEGLDEWLPAFTTDDPEDSPQTLPALAIDGTPIRNRAQFAWTQQRYILENIKLADAKAGFVITLASASLSAFFTRGPNIASPEVISNIIVAVLTALGVTSLISSIAFGAWSIKPRIGSRHKPAPTSWTDIARYPNLASYQADSRTLTEEDATEALTEQVFYMSRICHRKHLLISRAIILALVGGCALILDLIVLHLAKR
jgi:hypothetical protein